MIAAPIRKTTLIESENPTLNGCATTGASRRDERRVVQVGVARLAACSGRRLVRVRGQRRLELRRALRPR